MLSVREVDSFFGAGMGVFERFGGGTDVRGGSCTVGVDRLVGFDLLLHEALVRLGVVNNVGYHCPREAQTTHKVL